MIPQILNDIVDLIISIISHSGYFGIFLLMIAEGTIVPLPSEIIMPFSGYIVAKGKLDFFGVILAGTFGNLIGAVILYFLSSYLGRGFIIKYGRYILLKKSHLEITEKYFIKYGNSAVFISRMLPIVRGPISIPAGIAKMQIVKFITYTFLGSFIWNLSLTYVGFILRDEWKNILNYSNYFYIAVVIFVAFLLLLFLKNKKS